MHPLPAGLRQTGPNTAVVETPTSAWIHLQMRSPMVAWLAYRGVLESVTAVGGGSLVSSWACSTIQAATIDSRRWFYLRERTLERARETTNPAAVSRLEGIFAFPVRELMDRAIIDDDWGFEDHYVSEISILPGARVSWHDAGWLTAMQDADAAASYAAGSARHGEPFWEMLIDGKALVLNTDLRSRARNVVEAVWPDSLPALELGRIAAEIGLPFGYIAAYPISEAGRIHLKWVINAASDPETQRLLADHIATLPPDEVNLADLRRGTDDAWFRTPDLTSREVVIPEDVPLDDG